jgi:hypothetical protein
MSLRRGEGRSAVFALVSAIKTGRPDRWRAVHFHSLFPGHAGRTLPFDFNH